ncbi:unnamed protein product [Nesidiocoris tenuis]|uniref:Uncharacterized protein n=1 Tax=Nesidiocoris tenuis TaxID=355587 RepID=A0A6H5HEU0_9HEMI|nr:unnamed protein product [Nesidiocoris tenuis]
MYCQLHQFLLLGFERIDSRNRCSEAERCATPVRMKRWEYYQGISCVVNRTTPPCLGALPFCPVLTILRGRYPYCQPPVALGLRQRVIASNNSAFQIDLYYFSKRKILTKRERHSQRLSPGPTGDHSNQIYEERSHFHLFLHSVDLPVSGEGFGNAQVHTHCSGQGILPED